MNVSRRLYIRPITYIWYAFFLFIALIGNTSSICSQTQVQPGYVSGTWAKLGSPYKIMGEIVIHADSQLVIEPGVRVEFQGHDMFIIYGSLLSAGTESDSITFTSNPDSIDVGWHGLRFVDSLALDSSFLTYSIVEFGKADGYQTFTGSGGGVYVDTYPKLSIQHCRISNNYAEFEGGGIFIGASDILVGENVIKNNYVLGPGGGIYVANSDNCHIFKNLMTGNFGISGGGIKSYGSDVIIEDNYIQGNYGLSSPAIAVEGISSPIVRRNNISKNHSSDTDCAFEINIDCAPLVVSNIIVNNEGGGIRIGSSTPVLVNNIVCNNYGSPTPGSIRCNGTSAVFINNTICNNLADFETSIKVYNSNVVFYNNILWSNPPGYEVLLQSNSTASYYNNNIEGGMSAIGSDYLVYENNISSDPLFINPTVGAGVDYDATIADWRLQPTSPCINAGMQDTTGLNLPSTDYYGGNRVFDGRIDIGAYEHQEATSVRQLSANRYVIVYPIPSTGIINLQSWNTDIIEIKITDISGKTIFEESYSKTGNHKKEMIDLSAHQGIYTCTILFSNGEKTSVMGVIR